MYFLHACFPQHLKFVFVSHVCELLCYICHAEAFSKRSESLLGNFIYLVLKMQYFVCRRQNDPSHIQLVHLLITIWTAPWNWSGSII